MSIFTSLAVVVLLGDVGEVTLDYESTSSWFSAEVVDQLQAYYLDISAGAMVH